MEWKESRVSRTHQKTIGRVQVRSVKFKLKFKRDGKSGEQNYMYFGGRLDGIVAIDI